MGWLDRLVGLTAVCALALVCAPIASADTGGYTSHAWPGCGGGFNSGGWDDQGLVYVPCGNPSTIGVYDEAGHLVRSIPAGGFVSDVAPTRDGRYLYLAGSGAPRRMARQADGSYAADASWTAKRYQMWPGSWYTPSGYFIATDAAGNVYVADGTWGANQTNAVIKYDSAGTYVTHFGDYTKGWERGMFHWALGGLAVSASGSTIYTSEIGNNRVQRWTHTGDGVGYRVASDADLFGSSAANNADRAGYCDYAGWRGTLAAPYDVALDGADNLYVINTTCKQVLSFAPNFGPMRANLDVRVAGGDYPRPHGFTVGRNGAVYVGENQRVLRPAGGAQPGNGGAPAASSGGSSPVVEPAPSGGTPSGSSPTDILRDSTDISRPAIDPRPQTNLRPQITPRPQRPVQQAALADARPPRVQLGRLQVLRRAMRVPVGCSETCRVEVTARQGSLMAGRRVMWLRAGRTLPVAARITMRARAGRVMLQVRVRDRAGNTVAYRRAGTIAGAGTITRSRRR